MKRNLLFTKLCVILMMLFGGVTFVSAAEEACPTLTISPVTIMPGMETEVSIQYESEVDYSAFQLRVRLPEGLSFVGKELKDEDGEITTQYGAVGDACLASHSSEVILVTAEGSEWRGTLLFVAYNIKKKMMKKGTLCTFTVKADEKLAKSSEIKIEDMLFSGLKDDKEYHSAEMTDVIAVNNIKDEWDANEAANTKINEALTALMTALDAADAKISETCVESVKTVYLDKLGDCVTNINKQAMELNAKYAAIQLTEKDAEVFVADCAKAQAQFDAIVAESATAMTKRVEANEAANDTFQAAFTEISTLLNDADAKINDECPDVKETYLDQLAEIATQVNQKGMELGSLYAAIELTQEVADKAAAEINAFAAQIKEIVAAAVKAQNEIATGIHGINADFQNAEAVYSIGGVRLNKAAKGVNVVIRNGKAIKVVK